VTGVEFTPWILLTGISPNMISNQGYQKVLENKNGRRFGDRSCGFAENKAHPFKAQIILTVWTSKKERASSFWRLVSNGRQLSNVVILFPSATRDWLCANSRILLGPSRRNETKYESKLYAFDSYVVTFFGMLNDRLQPCEHSNPEDLTSYFIQFQ
jgi:hypothetical protein